MKRIILCFILFLTIACAPKIKVQRLNTDQSDEKAMEVTDKWVAKDTELAVQSILNQIENHQGFQIYLEKLGRRPKLFVGEVQNNTAEAFFPIGDLNDELLNEFSFSGKYILIDAASREKILKEITYQNNGMVDASQAKSIGKQTGADLIIFGDIRMKPETMGGKTIKDYSVNLRMTDIETGEEVLRTRFKVSKFSIRKGMAW